MEIVNGEAIESLLADLDDIQQALKDAKDSLNTIMSDIEALQGIAQNFVKKIEEMENKHDGNV
jgi:prefoldin subunit 5